VDVSCRTHADCVKIIKKTGDTLALKVYTANNCNALNFMTSAAASSNLISSNLAAIYQTPSTLLMSKNNGSLSASQANICTSSSYYATSTIPSSQTMNELSNDNKNNNINNMDGTKSLPHKKKRKRLIFSFLLFFFVK
jgi:hypothetical protein